MSLPERGTLVLVVGPSGVGKDSILDGAKARLAGDPRFVFARRLITRPANAGGEVHIALTPDQFAQRRAGGGMMLSWHAHDLDYGLPSSLNAALRQGRTVIANVSRTVIDEARRRFPPVRVVAITASDPVLAARLRRRGRENESEIAERLASAHRDRPSGPDVVTLRNDEALEAAVAAFVALLPAAPLAAQCPPLAAEAE